MLYQQKTASLNRNANYIGGVCEIPTNSGATPFEFRTRVEVSLPFNQKTVVRVRPDISLDELFNVVCKEACLDRDRYELVITNHNPNASRTKLSTKDAFSSYNTKEITLVIKSSEGFGNGPITTTTTYISNNTSAKSLSKAYIFALKKIFLDLNLIIYRFFASLWHHF